MYTDLNAMLVKSGWGSVEKAQGLQAFVDAFYHNLFAHHPETRPMFPADLRLQSIKMAETINLVVNGIDELDMLQRPLQELGRAHEALGITPDMYAYVIESALSALEQTSDKKITTDELDAWDKALEEVSGIMLSGCAQR